MRKLSFILSGLLFISANYVFAEDHPKVAIEHAKEAANASKTADVVHHAGAALEHTLTASIAEKGVAKNHLNAGAEELEQAIDHGNLGHLDVAVSHSKTAVEHLSAAVEAKKNKK
jgi:HEPN domain-containing protein